MPYILSEARSVTVRAITKLTHTKHEQYSKIK